ncbi:MAG: phosphotransferase [Lysobacterales bacterium]
MGDQTASVAWLNSLAELQQVKVENVQQLSAGLINQAWRVSTDQGDWMVRRNARLPDVDRELECRILRRVADAGLAPRVIACSPGYQISGWVDAPAWDRAALSSAERLDDLTRALRRLHGLPAIDLPATRWGPAIEERLAFSDSRDNPSLRASVASLVGELEQSSLTFDQRSLCHFDLHLGQMVGEAPVQFVDFEYARRANPMLDLAWLAQYHDLTPDEQLALLASYYGGADPQIRQRMGLALQLVRMLEFFWLEGRSSENPLSDGDGSRLRQLRLVLC